jgi:hypothetical protein
LKVATDLREAIEVVQSLEYSKFLSCLMPAFKDVLEKVPAVYIDDADEQVCPLFLRATRRNNDFILYFRN